MLEGFAIGVVIGLFIVYTLAIGVFLYGAYQRLERIEDTLEVRER